MTDTTAGGERPRSFVIVEGEGRRARRERMLTIFAAAPAATEHPPTSAVSPTTDET